mmetsp:Transcript_23203/g.47072  ORF Transcript_23203/g.47072 Transcript_23203/m.47072 type:complete len:439 (+) Transcript_23203:120-1436(+)
MMPPHLFAAVQVPHFFPISLLSLSDKTQHLSSVPEEKTIAAQGPAHVSKLLEELDIIKVAGVVVGTLVEGELLATIEAHVHRVGATNGPDLIGIAVGDIRDAVPTSLDVRLTEVEGVLGQIRLVGGDEHLASIQGHPEALVDVALNESHVLDAAGGATVVGDPEVLTGFPGEEEVTAGGDSEVGAVVVADLVGDGAGEVGGAGNAGGGDAVEGCVDGLLDLGLPVASGVFSGVDGARGSDHLSLSGSEADNGRGLTGELGAEGDALPGLAVVLGVEEEGGLAEDPALAVLEGEDLESVGDLLIGVKVGERPGLPGLATVVSLRKGSAGSNKVAVGGTVEVDVVEGVLERKLHGLPELSRSSLGIHGEAGRGGDGSSGGGRAGLGDEGAAIGSLSGHGERGRGEGAGGGDAGRERRSGAGRQEGQGGREEDLHGFRNWE